MYTKLLQMIYRDSDLAEKTAPTIEQKTSVYQQKKDQADEPHWNGEDIFLTTYGDQFFEGQQPTLRTPKKSYQEYLTDTLRVVHFLPFFSYMSDDDFSIVNYQAINDHLGIWEDIEEMRSETRLMFDFVCNHMSVESIWLQEYLNLNDTYKDLFIDSPLDTDTGSMTRPGTSPLLTTLIDKNGKERYIWTTLNEDQVDLNFKNPEVLLRMIDILLLYLEKGASSIRLDTVGPLWKGLGTSCIHLPETHKIIRLFRAIADEAAPGTVLITETNVPHKDNISYFGSGKNEAQMVCQFSLPPLTLQTIRSDDASKLKEWLRIIDLISKKTTFFDFLVSHDGIGLNPVRDILLEKTILELAEQLKKEGARVKYKKNPDGATSPYEINAVYLDALSSPTDTTEWRSKRFLAAHSFLVALPGVPAIYIQSVPGSRNDYKGVEKTEENRKINRQKFLLADIEKELQTDSLRIAVYGESIQMLSIRKKEKAFHPNSLIRLLDSADSLISFIREAKEERVLVIHNFSNQSAGYLLPKGNYLDLFPGQIIHCSQEQKLIFQSYEYMRLKIIK